MTAAQLHSIPSPNDTPRISHEIQNVDAELAKAWLGKNKRNRKIRESIVSRYRSDMAAGHWSFAADPIRFDEKGMLIDGQHRLTALSELPDLTIPMLVVSGLPADSQMIMDQGAKRTPGDQLGLLGYTNPNALAAAVKQYIAWREGFLFRDQKTLRTITSARIEQWVSEHPVSVAGFGRLWHLARQADAPPSIASAAAIHFSAIDPEAAERFFTLLARGAGTEGHPIVTLDKRLQRMRRQGVKIPNRDYLAFYIIAWNAWREGREMTKFQRPPGGAWASDTFPEPV